MNTVEDAALEYAVYRQIDVAELPYIGKYQAAFKSGVEFAQQRVSVKEELPNIKNGQINKEVIAFTSDDCAHIIIYDDYLGWIPNGTDVDVNSIKSWRPIDIK